MKIITVLSLLIICIAIALTAGCASSSGGSATATTLPVTTAPVIAQATVNTTSTVMAVTTENISISNETRQKYIEDVTFLKYLDSSGVTANINIIEVSSNNGACDTKLAAELNEKLVQGPKPGSEKLLQYRKTLMDAFGGIDGASNDLSKFKDKIADARNILNEYAADVQALTGAPVATPGPVDAEIVLSKSSDGSNILKITNKMRDEHNFKVEYEGYNGQIKTSNLEVTTPTLLPGESGSVTLHCSGCTGITITDYQAQNTTTLLWEDINIKQVDQ